MSTHGRWLLLQFPYYEIKDRFYMYTVGSMCYGIYFIVSFPMYYRYVHGLAYTRLRSTTLTARRRCVFSGVQCGRVCPLVMVSCRYRLAGCLHAGYHYAGLVATNGWGRVAGHPKLRAVHVRGSQDNAQSATLYCCITAHG